MFDSPEERVAKEAAAAEKAEKKEAAADEKAAKAADDRAVKRGPSAEEKAALKEVKAEEKAADKKAHPKKYVKVGDRARFLRNAATSWEMGTIKSYDGEFGVAQLDNGDKVGFGCDVPPAWEPA